MRPNDRTKATNLKVGQVWSYNDCHIKIKEIQNNYRVVFIVLNPGEWFKIHPIGAVDAYRGGLPDNFYHNPAFESPLWKVINE